MEQDHMEREKERANSLFKEGDLSAARDLYFSVLIDVDTYTQTHTDTHTDTHRIQHVVVLMEENRPFDHMFGWSGSLLNVNGLTGDEFNYVDPSDHTSEKIYVDDKAVHLNPCDPSHGTDDTTYKIFSGKGENSEANNGGFVAFEYKKHGSSTNYCDVMRGFTPENVPVITSLAKEFAIMDRFFASVPGPTWPNRMFALSGTSLGSTDTSVWYRDEDGKLFPQLTFFDQLEQSGHTWRNYYNDTPWELFMEKLAHSPHNLQPMDAFFADAAKGDLPSFSWINPRSGINITTGVGSNDQHPDHDVRAGEQFYKDIYEALRSSPAWNKTLFVITYDEHGGFYDHVIPPMDNIPPPGDNTPSYPEDFGFDRLGIRIPTLLISPWIKRGTVISAPTDAQKPFDNSEFELTSIMSSARKLLGMDPTPLTERDKWAATFDNVLMELDKPRDDCPMHLPDALPPDTSHNSLSAGEHLLPVNDLQKDIARVHSYLSNERTNYKTQGEHSLWVQAQYSKHAKLTRRWIDSKSSLVDTYTVVTMPIELYTVHDDNGWYLNGLKHGDDGNYTNSTAPYITLSSRDLVATYSGSDGTEVTHPICLDAGEGMAGSYLKVSICYPSPNPDINRDAKQHFTFHADGTLRYYNADMMAPPLCVTNANPELDQPKSFRAYLEVCDGRVEQSWAYHGVAPGDSGGGTLQYGDVANTLGIVSSL
mmetsp:Transcript_18374/g.26761  ORF Transcript_18374/g.26761 Transcript_18374/m.26761 type:complete len:705 (+) Transcript_18374:97-2211(+)